MTLNIHLPYAHDKILCFLTYRITTEYFPKGLQGMTCVEVDNLYGPEQLIESFKSTLEEVTLADLLLHLVDFSDPNFEEKRIQTENVLRDIGALKIPKMMIYSNIRYS